MIPSVVGANKEVRISSEPGSSPTTIIQLEVLAESVCACCVSQSLPGRPQASAPEHKVQSAKES
jgi:hypothetical protein